MKNRFKNFRIQLVIQFEMRLFVFKLQVPTVLGPQIAKPRAAARSVLVALGTPLCTNFPRV